MIISSYINLIDIHAINDQHCNEKRFFHLACADLIGNVRM